ncbi:hypothetical protein C1H21_08635 [Xanthomonas arboricola pv. juglandis]|nr:hypothetical protein C1H21_08635 [Xanthomonas arboricola pv. juglandis]
MNDHNPAMIGAWCGLTGEKARLACDILTLDIAIRSAECVDCGIGFDLEVDDLGDGRDLRTGLRGDDAGRDGRDRDKPTKGGP